MFAVAIDGELVAARVGRGEVVKILRDAEKGEVVKVEVATFLEGEGWVPVCTETIH